jgi:hypothetical protein
LQTALPPRHTADLAHNRAVPQLFEWQVGYLGQGFLQSYQKVGNNVLQRCVHDSSIKLAVIKMMENLVIERNC